MLNKTKPQPCDKAMNLYILNTEKTVFQKPFDGCERSFVAIPVANSNLVLVVIDTMCTLAQYSMTTQPVEVMYNESTLACYKSKYGTLSRKSLAKCINSHEREETIELCGDGQRLRHDRWLVGVLVVLTAALGHIRQLIRLVSSH